MPHTVIWQTTHYLMNQKLFIFLHEKIDSPIIPLYFFVSLVSKPLVLNEAPCSFKRVFTTQSGVVNRTFTMPENKHDCSQNQITDQFYLVYNSFTIFLWPQNLPYWWYPKTKLYDNRSHVDVPKQFCGSWFLKNNNKKNTIPAKYPNNKSCNDEDVLPFPTKTVLRPLKV